jgi:peroxiredoxin (alkyl hydroperoxide reductase subunit C)
MISPGTVAPVFSLEDQLGRTFRLTDYRGRRNVLLLFYPLDWTPICSGEVPELDRTADRFLREANTVCAALSIDSQHSHANWCADQGGVKIPVLADFLPRGAVSQAYGAWLANEQISDRATVIVDRDGVVRYAASVGKDGRRDFGALLATARDLMRQDRRAAPVVLTAGAKPRGVLYVQAGCFFCKGAKRAVENLHAQAYVTIKDIADPAARAELAALGPAAQGVPVLVIDGVISKGIGVVQQALTKAYGGVTA